MIPLPLEVSVLGHIYQVRQEEDDNLGDQGDENYTYAYINHSTQQIRICPNLAFDHVRSSLWHEVKHAVCEHVGIRGGKYSQEDVVTRSTAAELDTLRRNPHLVAFLMQEGE